MTAFVGVFAVSMIGLGVEAAMILKHPTVSITSGALVIRIPWGAVNISHAEMRRAKRKLTVQDVLEFVEAGRLAYRVGKTRTVRSLNPRKSLPRHRLPSRVSVIGIY